MAKRDTILVVEDEPLVALLISDALEDAGFRTEGAETAQEGKAKALANWDRLAAVTLDLNLKGSYGGDLGEYLLRRKLMAPIIVATGYGADGLHGAIMHLPVLAKPFDPDDLLDAIYRGIALQPWANTIGFSPLKRTIRRTIPKSAPRSRR